MSTSKKSRKRKEPEAIVEEEDKVTPPPSPKKSKPEIDWDEWVAATTTRNYLLKDPVLDYFNCHYSTLARVKPQFVQRIIKCQSSKNPENSFVEMIMSHGVAFEDDTVGQLFRKLHKDDIIDIGGGMSPHSQEKAEDTFRAMQKGIPVIYNGVLHNPDDKTYGVPDLIVRSDWVDQFIILSPIERKDRKISAPLLKDINDPEKPAKYHYVIVDIKFTTLRLRANGINLLNCGSFPAFKGQMCIYNNALARLQGYDPKKAYILGRRWTFKSKAIPYKGIGQFEKLGVIDFGDVDHEYVELTKKAVEWINDVRKNGHLWSFDTLPLPRKELYPNMSNYHDHPWREVKIALAESLKEITLLWMCGPLQREKAHAVGVYKWTDKKCTPKLLGIKGKRGYTLQKLIDINRDPNDTKILILPKYVLNNDGGWQNQKRSRELEFFVDFETIIDVFPTEKTNFSEFIPKMIFLIGVGMEEPVTKKWRFKHFCVDTMRIEDEKRMCTLFSEYIREECKLYKSKEPRLVHWSHAEPTSWDDAIERHGGLDIANERGWLTGLMEGGLNPLWFDLVKVFRDEPIVIKGCMNFSLKSVVRAMNAKGMIKTCWDTSTPYVDGLGAMMAAYKASKDASIRKISMRETPEICTIVKYNEVDCLAMYDIMSYLRKNHCRA